MNCVNHPDLVKCDTIVSVTKLPNDVDRPDSGLHLHDFVNSVHQPGMCQTAAVVLFTLNIL